jgi:signal transduction histidine kinase
MVSSIGQQAHEVTGLIEDLLVVARNELAEVDIFETTVNVVDQLEQTLEAGGSFTSEVVIESDAESPEALGDPGRIRQILRNLLTNAERYGGPEVRVTVAGCDGNVVVSVVDNGSGIPAGDRERVFEPYQSAHAVGDQTESVGIGLAISRQLAERMGGTLNYRYQDNHSIFSLTLRAATA